MDYYKLSMDKKTFKVKLAKVKLSQKKFAKLTGYSYSAVKGWEKTPKWVEYVINYIEIAQHINDVDDIAKSILPLKEKVKVLDLN